MRDFSRKVLSVAKRIPAGSFSTYKEMARLSGKPGAYRPVGNILAKNRDEKIPCHRIILSGNKVGGYFGSEKLTWKKAGLLLKEGVVGVLATDTIYGLCGSALNKKTTEKIYKLRRRNLKKPMIILISSLAELKKFGVNLEKWQKEYLKKIWPGKISIILPCGGKKFQYLTRGTETLSFRLPNKEKLIKILEISGPLVAPSANLEGKKPAETINEARKYFGKKVFYYDAGGLRKKPSCLIDISRKPVRILRP